MNESPFSNYRIAEASILGNQCVLFSNCKQNDRSSKYKFQDRMGLICILFLSEVVCRNSILNG